jgi:hypothetical protein
VAGEITIQIVEEGVLEEPTFDDGLDDMADWLDCRHEPPSVDPFSTLRRSDGKGYVYCLFCSRRFYVW